MDDLICEWHNTIGHEYGGFAERDKEIGKISEEVEIGSKYEWGLRNKREKEKGKKK